MEQWMLNGLSHIIIIASLLVSAIEIDSSFWREEIGNMLLIPLTLDPHGRWGPIMENFLNLTSHNLHYQFKTNKPNAATMLSKITRHPCPIGILKTADSTWKTIKCTHWTLVLPRHPLAIRLDTYILLVTCHV